VRVVGHDDDIGVMETIRRTEHYEPDVMLALHEVLSSDAVCIDGGANIGVLTLALALYAPRGRVIAFEPSQRCLPYLRYNLELNTVVNAHVEPLGLWSHPGTLMLNGDPRHPGGAYVGKADPTTVPEQIHVTSIDSWANEAGLTRLDLLKLDIEGAELQALEGASRTIASLRPSVLCEVNASALRQFHARDWTDLYRRLRSEYRWLFFVRENGGGIGCSDNGIFAACSGGVELSMSCAVRAARSCLVEDRKLPVDD
jgi:FkbM family methyltransferase